MGICIFCILGSLVRYSGQGNRKSRLIEPPFSVFVESNCLVKSSLVKPEQMTGSYELCMLIEGVVNYAGMAKVLCKT